MSLIKNKYKKTDVFSAILTQIERALNEQDYETRNLTVAGNSQCRPKSKMVGLVSAVVIALSCKMQSNYSYAQDVYLPQELQCRWQAADDERTFTFTRYSYGRIVLRIAGKGPGPVVTVDTSPIRIHAIGAEAPDRLTYEGKYSTPGFDMVADLDAGGFDSRIEPSVVAKVLEQRPDLKSHISISPVGKDQIKLTRSISRISWKGKHPVELLDVVDQHATESIKLTRTCGGQCAITNIGILLKDDKKTFSYKHFLTEIYPTDEAGRILLDRGFSVNPADRKSAAPGHVELLERIERSLATSLETMLDARRKSIRRMNIGVSTHTFGCDHVYETGDVRTCDCTCEPLETQETLPDGKNPNFAEVTLKDKPLVAELKKLVSLDGGGGTYLLVYRIRFHGSLETLKGECR